MKSYTHEKMMNDRIGCSLSIAFWLVVLLVAAIALVWSWSHGSVSGIENTVLVVVGLFGALMGYVHVAGDWWDKADLGLGFTGKVTDNWAAACGVLGLTVQHEEKQRVPMLRRIEGNIENWSARVALWPSQSIDHLKSKTDDMAKILGAASVQFDYVEGGHIVVRVSRSLVPVIEAPAVPVVVERPVTALDVVEHGVTVAHAANGKPFKLSLLDGHVLLAGVSRAGKSGYIWSMVIGLGRAVADGYVKLWGIDPKGIELGICEGWWDRYACEPGEIVDLLEAIVADMWARKEPLRGKARKFRPSQEMPLNVIVLDELAYVTKLLPVEKEKGKLSLQQRADRAVTEILTQGAGLGYILVGCVQDPTKETVPNRDLWGTTIALRLRAGMIPLVCGPGARNEGALCDTIPPKSKGGAGYAYVEDDAGGWQLVRARWWEDDEIRLAWRAVEQYRIGVTSTIEVTEVEQAGLLLAAPGNA